MARRSKREQRRSSDYPNIDAQQGTVDMSQFSLVFGRDL